MLKRGCETGQQKRTAARVGWPFSVSWSSTGLEAVMELELQGALAVTAHETLLEVLGTEQIRGIAVCITVNVAGDDGAARVARSDRRVTH